MAARPLHIKPSDEYGAGERPIPLFSGKAPNWSRYAGASDQRLYLPEYRERLERDLCPVCGLLYVPWSDDDRAYHRKTHAREMAILHPKPSERLQRRLSEFERPTLVDQNSPLWMHREMYERARRFNRESGYFGIMWDEDGEREGDAEGHLLVDPETCRIMGAASFRLRSPDDSQSWALQWIWITPIARRSGILKRSWPNFNDRYGPFLIEGPLSPAMLAFVDRLELRNRVWGPLSCEV